MKRLFGTPLKILGFTTILVGLFFTGLFLTLSLLGPIIIVIGLFLYLFDAVLRCFAANSQKFRTAQFVFSGLYSMFSFCKIGFGNSVKSFPVKIALVMFNLETASGNEVRRLSCKFSVVPEYALKGIGVLSL